MMIRPEHLSVADDAAPGRTSARMRIDTIINYGDHALILGHVGTTHMRARVVGTDAATLHEGDSCTISWEDSHVTPILR